MHQLTPFQQKALNFQNHISLTANAGSGKTFVLAKRYVEIALNKNLPLSKIVAITFTEKAAGELNKKIAGEIEGRIKTETSDSILKSLHRIRRQLTSANISTIHSFCINLLKEFSPEAGLDANFTPLNQADADELLSLSIDEFIRRNLQDTNHTRDLKDVIRLLGGKNNFESEIRSVVKDRKTLERLNENLYAQDDSEILSFYSDYIKKYLKNLVVSEINKLISEIEQLNLVVLDLDPGNNIAERISELAAQINQQDDSFSKLSIFGEIAGEILTKQGTIKKAGYIKKEYANNSDLINSIESSLDDLKNILQLNYSEDISKSHLYFTRKIFNIAFQILNVYQDKKKHSAYLDFEDILIETKNLTQNTNFVDQLYKKYDYVMIDEYQDTNEIQYEIFMPILNNLKHGNLFVVGDEKQSIYMFRDAELEIFNRTKDEISSVNEKGDLLLPHSFRVTPQIAQFVNKVFKKLLSDPNPVYNEVEYNELICSRPETDSGEVEFLIADEETDEAELTAEAILKTINEEDASPGEFAILCRKRNTFFELEKALNERNISYVIAGGKGFFQRQTVYDVYNYISFLLNPGDDAAIVGILRAPFFLLPDDLIYRISLSNGNTFYDKLKNYANQDGSLKEIINLLNRHINLSSSVRISSLLREILKSTQYWGVVSGKQNFEQELSNLFKLVGVARGFEQQSFKTIYDFKIYLDEAISLFEDEGQAQLSGFSDAVKIMTLHQSKGLEFKRVILYKCSEKSRENNVKAKSILLDKNLGVLTKVPHDKNYFSEYESPAIVDVQNHIQSRKQNAENKRLLYVGLTRAIDYLYISAKIKKNKIEKNSFLDLIATGLNSSLQKGEVTLNSDLKFMKGADADFEIYEKNLSTEINVVKEISIDERKEKHSREVKVFKEAKLAELSDHEKNEIVSATKIAIFTQCPTKYYLTYELGYTELMKLTKAYSNNYEFKHGEDEDVNIYADLKGQIIHKILEMEVKKDELKAALDDMVPKYIDTIHSADIDIIKERIQNDLKEYFESSTYKEISSSSRYSNEYEVYSKESDYYVYGIIDKLIIDDSVIKIVDYKTDNLKNTSVKSKAEHYLPQLKFYAYCTSKKFPQIEKIIVKLIFIQEPNESVEFEFTQKEIADFGDYISKCVRKIRIQEFAKNLDHCPQCHFNLDGECIYRK